MDVHLVIINYKRDGVTESWYLFREPLTGIDINRLKGPYRDKTDAENAAHDEAKQKGWEIL